MEVNEWVVVASRTQAKIFKRFDTTRPLQWIYTLVNKEDLSPRPTETNGHNAHAPEYDCDRFAKKIANALKMGADQHSYSRLHLFAEPHLMGRIRQNIPRSMKHIDIQWIAKDLEKATSQEILERVS